MPIDLPHPGGLKPTLRQMMILVLWAGLLTAGLRFCVWARLFDAPTEVLVLSLVCTITSIPIALGFVLLFLFDRRGPVRSWYIQGCQAWGGLFGSTTFLVADLMSYVLTGHPTLMFPMFPILGLLTFWSCSMHLRSIWPGHCQSCGRRAVIAAALRRPIPREWLGKARGWCATCGKVYEKQGADPWQLATS